MVPCTGSQILDHWTTREVLVAISLRTISINLSSSFVPVFLFICIYSYFLFKFGHLKKIANSLLFMYYFCTGKDLYQSAQLEILGSPLAFSVKVCSLGLCVISNTWPHDEKK